ncbi:hypothetical protein KR093_003317, partial [Drosophila rubida]
VLTIEITNFLFSKEAVKLKWTNVICTSHNESWVHVNDCRLKAISRNLTILNVNITILHPTNDIFIDAQLYKKANGYKPWLIKSMVDFCRFSKTSYNPYAKIVFSLLKSYSNLNHSCPYVGHIIVQGFYITPAQLGLPFPTGDYLVALKWIYYKKLQASTNVYFSFTEDYIDM